MENKNSIERQLEKARELFYADQADKIQEQLLGFKDSDELNNHSIAKEYYKLLAFGYLRNNQMLNADEICQRVIGQHPQDLDFYYLKAAIHFALREFKQALEVFDHYLALYNSVDGDQSFLTMSDKYQSRFYNLAGQANLNLGHKDIAYEFFLRACRLDEKNQTSYINLYNYFVIQNSSNEALQILKQGIGQIENSLELMLLKNSFSSKQTIPVV